MSGTLLFVDIKISNQQRSACCLRALPATLSRFVFLCVLERKMLILYIERVSSKFGQIFACIGASKSKIKSRIDQHG